MTFYKHQLVELIAVEGKTFKLTGLASVGTPMTMSAYIVSGHATKETRKAAKKGKEFIVDSATWEPIGTPVDGDMVQYSEADMTSAATADLQSFLGSTSLQLFRPTMDPSLMGGSTSSGGTVQAPIVKSAANKDILIKRDDGKIHPALLEYIRSGTLEQYQDTLTFVSYSEGGGSNSLKHRMMFQYIMKVKGADTMTVVGLVTAKAWDVDQKTNVAIQAIPKNKIPFILSEHSIVHGVGPFARYLKKVFNKKAIFDESMVALVPEFIGAGSKEEQAKGTAVPEATTKQRRLAFARGTCEYLTSLYTNVAFRALVKAKIAEVEKKVS